MQSNTLSYSTAVLRMRFPVLLLALVAITHGLFAQVPQFSRTDYPTGTTPNSLTFGDFNGDGKLDIAVANQNSFFNSTVGVFLGNGDGTFQAQVTYPTGQNPNGVNAGDFNGDGKLDLVMANQAGGDMSILIGNGDGSFQPPVNFPVGSNPQYLTVADFNLDSKLDVVIAIHNNPGTVAVLLGNGDGSFQSPVTYAVDPYPYGIKAGDFNGDHIPDLAVANSGGLDVSILLGNGNGTFQTAVNYPIAGVNLADVTVADFNGDGKLDLAVTNTDCDPNLCTGTGHAVSVLLGNGDGTFGSAVNYLVDLNPYFLTSADMNGDGKQDIVTTNQIGDVSLLLGNGNGTFQAAVNYPVGTQPFASRAADFNGDGRLDLAVVNAGSNNISILLQPVPQYVALVQQPINADASSVFNATRGVVPVKFTLTLNGTATCNLVPATISLARTAGGTVGPIDESIYQGSADSGSAFRIDSTSCQYVFNLAAKSLGIGTYLVKININGGAVGSATFGLR